MSRNEIKKLFIAGIAFAGGLAYLISKNIINTAQAIESTILFVLVCVTAIYAKRTAEIAKETREQRYSECLPLLVPSVNRAINEGLDPDEVAYESLQSGIGIEVIWRNEGKGVAINSTFSLYGATLPSGEVRQFPALESRALGSGQQIATSFDVYSTQRDKPERYQPRLEAKYQDIYKRKITTVQEFRIEEQNNTKRAFLGDLYFTVNDKRLGEEATQHDS